QVLNLSLTDLSLSGCRTPCARDRSCGDAVLAIRTPAYVAHSTPNTMRAAPSLRRTGVSATATSRTTAQTRPNTTPSKEPRLYEPIRPTIPRSAASQAISRARGTRRPMTRENTTIGVRKLLSPTALEKEPVARSTPPYLVTVATLVANLTSAAE